MYYALFYQPLRQAVPLSGNSQTAPQVRTLRNVVYVSDAEVMDRVYCKLNVDVEEKLRMADYNEQNYSA